MTGATPLYIIGDGVDESDGADRSGEVEVVRWGWRVSVIGKSSSKIVIDKCGWR